MAIKFTIITCYGAEGVVFSVILYNIIEAHPWEAIGTILLHKTARLECQVRPHH